MSRIPQGGQEGQGVAVKVISKKSHWRSTHWMTLEELDVLDGNMYFQASPFSSTVPGGPYSENGRLGGCILKWGTWKGIS
jgi:hypothetical protein